MIFLITAGAIIVFAIAAFVRDPDWITFVLLLLALGLSYCVLAVGHYSDESARLANKAVCINEHDNDWETYCEKWGPTALIPFSVFDAL